MCRQSRHAVCCSQKGVQEGESVRGVRSAEGGSREDAIAIPCKTESLWGPGQDESANVCQGKGGCALVADGPPKAPLRCRWAGGWGWAA